MSWKNKPTSFAQEARKDLLSNAKLVALKVLRGVVFHSPVSTGRFRGNWIVGLGNRSLRQLKKGDKVGSTTYKKGSARIRKSKVGKSIFITNNLPYARRLNEGWSDQAPASFVEASIRKATK